MRWQAEHPATTLWKSAMVASQSQVVVNQALTHTERKVCRMAKKKKNAPTPKASKRDWYSEIEEMIDEAFGDTETMDRDETREMLESIINHCTVKLDAMEEDDIDDSVDDDFDDLDDDLDD
jgi:hypothetical protein